MQLSVSYITSFTCDTIGTYLRQIVLHPLMHAFVYVGEWPLVINIRTAFTAGNHSVSITAADTIGLSAQNIVPFTLLDTTRTNRELMLIDYHCIMYLKIYVNTKNFRRTNVRLHAKGFIGQIQECSTCNYK